MKPLKRMNVLSILFLALVMLAGCTFSIGGNSTPDPGLQESVVSTEASAPEKPDNTDVSPSLLPRETPGSEKPEDTEPSAKEGYNEGEKMPDFTVDTIDGDSFTLSEHEGKIVFINLFATWCGPCMGEMPDIKDLYDNYQDRVDFVLVNVWEDKATAASFSEGNGFTCPVGYVEGDYLGDYMVEFIPQTFILGPDGVIEYYAAGASDYDSFNNVIERLLKEQE